MAEKVRFGLIGFGNIGTRHAEALWEGKIENAELTAVCDVNSEKLKKADEKHRGVKLFENAEDMMKSGTADAIIIAVPHYDHPPLAIAGFRNGMHVLCEKPAGVYGSHVREMNAEAAKRPELTFGMMFNQRTNCVYRKMREIVQSGQLGEFRRSNWIITDWYRPQCYYDSGEWRASWIGEGGGVLLNQCPHNLDLWQWICGMPTKITAFMAEGKWHKIEAEDDVTIYAEYANGATGAFITTTADYPGTNRFEVTGSMGKLVCERDKLLFYKNRMDEREYNAHGTEPFGGPGYDVIEVETDGRNPQHDEVLRAFAANVLNGEPLTAHGSEGIHGLLISNAAHLSAWTGKTVELPIDDELFHKILIQKGGR